MTHKARLAVIGLIAAAAPASALQAETPAGTAQPRAVETITITAQRREQTLDEVPLAVSAFDEGFLQRSRTQTVADLAALTPGLSGTAVATTTPRITVRGVSTEDFGVGSDPALGIYVDEVYLGRGVSSITDLFDIARVEVVKGPQGSLFGRNTTAGAISITTNRPADMREASLSASVFSFGGRDATGMINLPLEGGWAFRLAGTARQRDGFAGNVLGGEIGAIDTRAARAGLGYEGEEWSALFSLEARRTRNEPGPYINPVLVGTDPFGPIASDLIAGTGPDAPRDHIDAYRFTVQIERRFAGGTTLTAITGAGTFDNTYLEDTDASPLRILHFGTDGSQDSISQELRLSGGSDRIDWMAGVSAARDTARSGQFALYDEDALCLLFFGDDCLTATGLPGDPRVVERSQARNRNTSLALYGDVTWHTGARLSLTAGLRISQDEKRFTVGYPDAGNLLGAIFVIPPAPADAARFADMLADGRLAQSSRTTSVQPRVAALYRVSDAHTAYATASRGYKAGGFNQLEAGPGFTPESIWNYEAGLRGQIPLTRWRYDLSVFHYTYDDLQVLIDVAGAVVTRNAASASGSGAEALISGPLTGWLTVSASAALLDARYDTFQPDAATDYSGNSLVRAPRFSAALVADADQPLTARLRLRGRLEYSYRSREFFDPSNSRFESQGGYGLVNLAAGLRLDDRYEVRAFARNLSDRNYLVDTSVIVPGLLEYTQRGEPRLTGIELRASF